MNKDRLVNEFIEMVQISSLSKKEARFAAVLMDKLSALGFDVHTDDSGEKCGGETGNVIAVLRGDASIPAIMFGAHMDTVVPGEGIKPQIRDGVIYSDGTTVLGSDDKAGIAAILETMRYIKESNIPHGDIELVFTIAEEGGLFGAKYLDISKLKSRMAFELDSSGEVGNAIVQAPASMKLISKITGRAAHAGIAPEKGISAIMVAARAIDRMKLLRIDHETTANIGKISGGTATNIVCDFVEMTFEARSLVNEKVEAQMNHMVECIEKACEEFGAKCENEVIQGYKAFNIGRDTEIIRTLEAAMKRTGMTANLVSSGGGSDANYHNAKGLPTVNLATGMTNVHTTSEYIAIESMMKTAELVAAIVQQIAEKQ